MARTAEKAEKPQHASSALAVTSLLTDFIRQELRRYRLATFEDGKAVSVAVLAGRIQAIDDDLDFSPETLRRYLNDDKQQTGHELIRAIADFLVEEEWLTPADLQAPGQTTNFRAAFALNAFFGIVDSKRNMEFYRALAGPYVHYHLATDRLVRVECLIDADKTTGVLSIVEKTQAYDILPGTAAEESFLANRQVELRQYKNLDNVIALDAQPVGAPLIASGFGVADHRILTWFLTDMRAGTPTTYNILRIGFDDADDVVALRGQYGAGWTIAAGAENAGPLGDFLDESPRLADTERIFVRLRS